MAHHLMVSLTGIIQKMNSIQSWTGWKLERHLYLMPYGKQEKLLETKFWHQWIQCGRSILALSLSSIWQFFTVLLLKQAEYYWNYQFLVMYSGENGYLQLLWNQNLEKILGRILHDTHKKNDLKDTCHPVSWGFCGDQYFEKSWSRYTMTSSIKSVFNRFKCLSNGQDCCS